MRNRLTKDLRSGFSTKRRRPIGVLFERLRPSDDDSANRPHTVFGWIKSQLAPLASLRDEILVTASILYVTGYAVWSFHAWRNRLGLLPALDPQYFIAGLLPFLIVVIAYLIGRLLRLFLLEIWPDLVGENVKGFWGVVRVTLLTVFAGSFILMILGPVPALLALVIHLAIKIFAPNFWSNVTNKEAKPSLAWGVVVIGFPILLIFLMVKREQINKMAGISEDVSLSVAGLFFTVAVTFLPPIKDSLFNIISKIYRWLWVYLAPFAFIVLGFQFYLQRVYPNVPQEFGGVLPRCAYLDVVKAQVSSDTLSYILPEGAPTGEPIAHSKQVKILFSGSNVVLVQAGEKVLEINKGIIQSIEHVRLDRGCN